LPYRALAQERVHLEDAADDLFDGDFFGVGLERQDDAVADVSCSASPRSRSHEERTST
jgi:hypothetical protein